MEQQQAISSVGPHLTWNLSNVAGERYQQMLNNLFNCRPSELRTIPRLRIRGSPAIDVGGVFRDQINEIFRSLIQSEIFVHSHTSDSFSFAIFDDAQYDVREREYVVFGRILYWFVFIHRCIPYPIAMDLAIAAFAIKGEIPFSILSIINPALAGIVDRIRTYSESTSEEA